MMVATSRFSSLYITRHIRLWILLLVISREAAVAVREADGASSPCTASFGTVRCSVICSAWHVQYIVGLLLDFVNSVPKVTTINAFDTCSFHGQPICRPLVQNVPEIYPGWARVE